MFEYYDSGTVQEPPGTNQLPGLYLKFIDCRQTGGNWERIAIGFFGTAYLCND